MRYVLITLGEVVGLIAIAVLVFAAFVLRAVLKGQREAKRMASRLPP